MTSEKIRNVHCDKIDQQKDFLDPVTTAAVGAFGWFAVKAALQGIIGWLAVQLFVPIWNKVRSKNDASNQELSTQEQDGESSVCCPCGRRHGG